MTYTTVDIWMLTTILKLKQSNNNTIHRTIKESYHERSRVIHSMSIEYTTKLGRSADNNSSSSQAETPYYKLSKNQLSHTSL